MNSVWKMNLNYAFLNIVFYNLSFFKKKKTIIFSSYRKQFILFIFIYMKRSVIEIEIISSTNKTKKKNENIKVFYCSKIKPFFGVTSISRSQNNAFSYKSRQYAIWFLNLLVYNDQRSKNFQLRLKPRQIKLNGNGFAFGSFEWKTEKKENHFWFDCVTFHHSKFNY